MVTEQVNSALEAELETAIRREIAEVRDCVAIDCRPVCPRVPLSRLGT